MDLVLIELVCWGGLLFFFWALKDGLGKVESDIESYGLFQNARALSLAQQRSRYYRPDSVREPIGTYGGELIYRYVVISGRTYQFDRVSPPESQGLLGSDERCVAPGLVYLECGAAEQAVERT